MTEFDLGRILPIDKGEWNDTYSTEAGPGYEKLDKVTSGSGSYLSLVANNTAPLTDRASWFPYVDGASIDALVVALNTAKQNAITAAGAANTQALFAEEKGNLAHNKAGEAEAAKVAANTAAGAADAARQAIATEMAAKQNKIDQNLKTTDKSVVGAINEVLTIFSADKPQGVAVRRWNTTLITPIGESYGDLDFLRELPRLLGLGCYLVQKDHTRRKLNPNSHYQFLDGTEAKLDGSMGDYMWGWKTKFYYAYWTEGDYYYEGVSLHPIAGKLNYVIPIGSTSAVGGSVVDRDTLELVSVVNNAPRYRGGNNDAAKDTAFNTQLGMPATILPVATFGAYARKKGLGWEGYWYGHAAIIGALTRIILGTRHIQTAYNPNKDANGLYQGGLGEGVSNAGAWWGSDFGNYPIIPTGVGIELGDACGVASHTVLGAGELALQTLSIPVFFGLKNFYGHLNRWERGKLISRNADTSGDVYVVPQIYSDYNVNSVAGLTKAATIPGTAGYIMQISNQNLCHAPTVVGGSSSTYYADYLYGDTATSGLRVPAVGGSANAGGYDGPEYLRANFAVSASYAHYGSPLCESEDNWDTMPIIVA